MTFSIAAVQMCSTDDVSNNLARARELVLGAAASGAGLVGLPENFAYLGSDRDHKIALAEPLDGPDNGPILAAMKRLATEAKVWLLLGGFPERVAPLDGAAGQSAPPA